MSFEVDSLNQAIAKVWKAMGISHYTGHHISEHVQQRQDVLEYIANRGILDPRDYAMHVLQRGSNGDAYDLISYIQKQPDYTGVKI